MTKIGTHEENLFNSKDLVDFLIISFFLPTLGLIEQCNCREKFNDGLTSEFKGEGILAREIHY